MHGCGPSHGLQLNSRQFVFSQHSSTWQLQFF
jgi:hypothetical protein